MPDLHGWITQQIDEREQLVNRISPGGYAPDEWRIEPSRSGRWARLVAYSRTNVGPLPSGPLPRIDVLLARVLTGPMPVHPSQQGAAVSNVTDMFVLIGDSDGPTGRISAEDIAPKVAEAISTFISDEPGTMPVIDCNRDDWHLLQGGRKAAGGAAIWFGWNYAHPEELEEHLKGLGFKHITVWSHHEFAGRDGIPPRVVSW